MKLILVILFALTANIASAEVKYNCSVTNYTSPTDVQNSVDGLIVTLDSKASKGVLPVTKKRVSVSLSTFKTDPAEIKKYGQYQLHVTISEDKDVPRTQNDIYVKTGASFIGLDDAIQILTTASYGGRSAMADVGVMCNKL